MTHHDQFDRSLAQWLDSGAPRAATADVLERAMATTRRRRPYPRLVASPGSHWFGNGIHLGSGGVTLGRTGVRATVMLLLLLAVLALAAGAVLVGGRPVQPVPLDLGIFEPVAGWTVHGDASGVWGDNPDGPDVQLASRAGIPLGWSRDGTRLLLYRQGLVVLDADGSETRLTSDGPTVSQSNRAAAISPDGSRVVFVTSDGTGNTGALYSVASGGGVPDVLLVRDGVEAVTISPDGRQIAFLVGRGDSDHGVWLMNADGSDPREILANEVTLGAGHDRGLAWSPAGDRLALGLAGVIYTFAPDGTGFKVALNVGGRVQPFWSPDGSQLETTGPRHPGGRP